MDVCKLKEVFDLCDEDNEGTVIPERIIELARQANSGKNNEAMSRLENALDVFGTNPISFEQFCNAIKSIEKIDNCDADNLVRRMSITFQNINDHEENTKYLLDDSSTTYNEYDYNNVADEDIRESVLSNTLDGSFDNSLRL
ncbi:hypothetical protein GJ496_007292 [Pomphorhynchus laevis]|nr:hypothetical protein GJ496_007292 [Pomphorhynchus laevis]